MPILFAHSGSIRMNKLILAALLFVMSAFSANAKMMIAECETLPTYRLFVYNMFLQQYYLMPTDNFEQFFLMTADMHIVGGVAVYEENNVFCTYIEDKNQ